MCTLMTGFTCNLGFIRVFFLLYRNKDQMKSLALSWIMREMVFIISRIHLYTSLFNGMDRYIFYFYSRTPYGVSYNHLKLNDLMRSNLRSLNMWSDAYIHVHVVLVLNSIVIRCLLVLAGNTGNGNTTLSSVTRYIIDHYCNCNDNLVRLLWNFKTIF